MSPGDHNPYRSRRNERDMHVGHFSVTRMQSAILLRYQGQVFVRIRKGNLGASSKRPNTKSEALAKGLPKGFPERVAQMVFEFLRGTRTELWDAQAIHGAEIVEAHQQTSSLCDDPNCPHAGIPHFRTALGPKADNG
jgi:hypothetical protein